MVGEYRPGALFSLLIFIPSFNKWCLCNFSYCLIVCYYPITGQSQILVTYAFVNILEKGENVVDVFQTANFWTQTN